MIPEDKQRQLKELTKVFLEENSKLNLSALRTEESCWIGNILDSVAALEAEEFCTLANGKPIGLKSSQGSTSIPNAQGSTSIPKPLPPSSVAKALDDKEEEDSGVEVVQQHNSYPCKILDIGTGGGFPLLPLALCLPQTICTGIDATEKKMAAIKRIVDTLSIPNVELKTGRTEELGHSQDLREQFDIVTARALAPLNTLIEYAAPFAKVNGLIIAWKSMQIDQELQDSLRARTALHAHLERRHEYTLPEDWGKRQLLIFRKTSPTPKKYPRETGVPKKDPLI